MTHAEPRWVMTMILWLSVFSWVACGGDEPECRNNSDCQSGQNCVDGECVEVPGTGDTGTDTADTADTATQPGSTDTSGIDTHYNTDSVDTETACEDDPSVENGQPCTSACECFSGHCANGFCCDDGECCADALDCGGDLCATAMCLNATCDYSPVGYACGTVDAYGETCDGGWVCNGAMECVPLVTDCGLFAPNRTQITCTEFDAETSCYTSCNSANQATRCAPGAVCVAGVCRSGDDLPDGAVCASGDQCRSGHCGDGFCCVAGECCQLVEDCNDQCRTSVACGTNYQCFGVNMACGLQDSAGTDTCVDGSRCDGRGGCAVVQTCAAQGSPYRWDGSYSCSVGAVLENCRTSCTSSSECQSGAQCDTDSGTCRMGNGGVCGQNSDCASNHCNNGFCCGGGTCCSVDTDCNTPCRTGGVCNQMLFNCEGGGTNEVCGTQSTGCSGSDRCDGHGNCVATTDTCDIGADSYTCQPGSVTRNCSCVTNDDCDTNALFCDGTYFCTASGLCRYDIFIPACSSDACFPATCNEAERRCTYGADPCEDEADDCDAKLCVPDGAGGYLCEPNSMPNGTLCDDGNSCTGSGNVCLNGVCDAGAISAWPCHDGDPCTVDACEVTGPDSVNCLNTPISAGDSCNSDYGCYSSSARCMDLGTGVQCVDTVDVCAASGQGICMWRNCYEGYTPGEITCTGTNTRLTRSLMCDQMIVLNDSDFETQFYVDYGSCGSGYTGREVTFLLFAGQTLPDHITDAVLVVTGSRNFTIFELTNDCNAQSCQRSALNSMGDIYIDRDNNAYLYYLIDYADMGLPGEVTVELLCE